MEPEDIGRNAEKSQDSSRNNRYDSAADTFRLDLLLVVAIRRVFLLGTRHPAYHPLASLGLVMLHRLGVSLPNSYD